MFFFICKIVLETGSKPSLQHGRAAVAEASKHFVHAVTGRGAHRGVEGRLARELRIKVGRVVSCA